MEDDREGFGSPTAAGGPQTTAPTGAKSGLRTIAMVRLTIILGLVLSGGLAYKVARSNPDQDAGAGLPPLQSCGSPALEPIRALAFTEANHALESASVAILTEDPWRWVLSGTEVGVAPGADEMRVARVVHESGDEVRHPIPESGALSLELPFVVASSSDAWSLVWAEVDSTVAFNGPPPQFLLRRLWAADRVANSWTPPRPLLSGTFSIDWHRRTVHYSRSGGPLLLVSVLDFAGQDHLMFGPISGQLRPVPLPGDWWPWTASFGIDPTGTVILATIAERDERHILALLSSTDDGRSWSEPVVVHETTDRAQEIRVIVDRDASVHILLLTSRDDLIHFADAGRREAVENMLHANAGAFLRWAAGQDRCGRPTVVREVLRGHDDLQLEVMRWTGLEWTRPQRLVPGFDGFNLFDSVNHEGTWFVGWTGAVEDDEDLEVWLVAP